MKKAEQSEVTHGALLKAARELFTERGYADTTTEEIAKRAGMTRGALYYQFRDKSALFRAVLEDLNLNIVKKVMSTIQSGQGEPGEPEDLWDKRVHAGTAAYLDACLDPTVQRIALIEASAVLGWEEHRDLDEKYGLGLIRGTLQEVLEAGLIAPQPLEPLAHLVLGAITEAVMYIARADDVSSARKEMGTSLEHLFDGLRVKG